MPQDTATVRIRLFRFVLCVEKEKEETSLSLERELARDVSRARPEQEEVGWMCMKVHF